jgi:hypothetical protein
MQVMLLFDRIAGFLQFCEVIIDRTVFNSRENAENKKIISRTLDKEFDI